MKTKFKSFIVLLLIVFIFLFLSCDLFFTIDNHNPLPKTESVTVVKTFEKQKCDYLFIMYVDGDNDLQDVLFEDLNEVEEALYNYNLKAEPKPKIKVVALWDGWEDNNLGGKKTRIFQLGADSNKNPRKLCSNTLDLTAIAYDSANNWINYDLLSQDAEVDMSSKSTLVNFLNWTHEYYDAKYEILQFSNHGGGPRAALGNDGKKALCWDFTTGTTSEYFLKTKDVSDALHEAGYGMENQFDMLIFDICLGASIEDSYQFRNYAKYLLGSANAIPKYGLDYTNFYDSITSTSSMTDFGKSIINSYKKYYTNFIDWNKEIEIFNGIENAKYQSMNANTLSLFDLSKIENVADKIEELVVAIDESMNVVLNIDLGKDEPKKVTVRDFIKNHISKRPTYILKNDYTVKYQGTFTWLYDIGFLTKNIQGLCAAITSIDEETELIITELDSKAKVLEIALKEAIVYTWREGPSILQNGGISPAIDSSNADNSLYYGEHRPYGMTIAGANVANVGNNIYPQYTDGKAPDFYKNDLAFGKDTSWGYLLEYYFGK